MIIRIVDRKYKKLAEFDAGVTQWKAVGAAFVNVDSLQVPAKKSSENGPFHLFFCDDGAHVRMVGSVDTQSVKKGDLFGFFAGDLSVSLP